MSAMLWRFMDACTNPRGPTGCTICGEVVWRPGSGPVVFLTIPEARETSLHALDAAENAQIADDFTGFERAIELFHEINDAIRAAMRWRHAARIDA